MIQQRKAKIATVSAPAIATPLKPHLLTEIQMTLQLRRLLLLQLQQPAKWPQQPQLDALKQHELRLRQRDPMPK